MFNAKYRQYDLLSSFDPTTLSKTIHDTPARTPVGKSITVSHNLLAATVDQSL